MAKARSKQPNEADRHAEAMEVHAFDLLAHVEAMLRQVRAYQEDVQQLRRTAAGPPTSVAEQKSDAAALEHVKQLRKTCDEFCKTLDDIVESVETAVQRREDR